MVQCYWWNWANLTFRWQIIGWKFINKYLRGHVGVFLCGWDNFSLLWYLFLLFLLFNRYSLSLFVTCSLLCFTVTFAFTCFAFFQMVFCRFFFLSRFYLFNNFTRWLRTGNNPIILCRYYLFPFLEQFILFNVWYSRNRNDSKMYIWTCS